MGDRPEWWSENERLRTEFDLPTYRPPRFSDGVYTHEVVEPVEDAFDCRVRFVGVNTSYEDDWEVRVDGEAVLEVGRRRDERGNTVYRVDSETFDRRLRRALGDR